MPVNEKQLEKLKAWFKEKGVNMNCTSCGNHSWTIGDIVVAPKFVGGVVLGGPMIPLIQMVCKNCGYVRSYAAVPMGLLEEMKEEEEQPEKAKKTERKK